MVLAALLTGVAWWLAQRRPAYAPDTHAHDETTQVAPWLVWSAPSIRRDATTSTDASMTSDAGPSTEARDRLGALLVAQICARRDECQCGTYPSPYAEGHETATTCEADVLRDFLRWWGDHDGAHILADEAELARQVSASVGCSGTRAHLALFLERGEPRGARGGEACDDETSCRSELYCSHGRCTPLPSEGARCDGEIGCAWGLECVERHCARHRRFGESCGAPREAECDVAFVCVEGRCDFEALQCKRGTMGRRLESGPYAVAVPSECIPNGTACSSSSDCGWGDCEGEGGWICDVPAAHAEVPLPLDEGHGEPRCVAGGSCEFCNCPPGESCRSRRGDSRCVHVGARGESCHGTWACADGLVCDFHVPAGGHCLPTLCRQTAFFPQSNE